MEKKRGSLLLPVIVLLSFLAAALVLVFVTLSMRSRMEKDRSANEAQEQTEETAVENIPETETGEPETETEAVSEALSEEFADVRFASQTDEVPPHRIIFVGDSRTEGMARALYGLGDSCLFCAKSGEGYHWFTEDGIVEMDKAIRACPDAPVVFNLGVNDPEQLHRYLEVYHVVETAYADTTFYYMSVNPVEGDAGNTTDEEILEFNAAIREAFPDRYIDTYTRMKQEGFETVDGLHYTEETYQNIHRYSVQAIYGLYAG